MLMVAKNNLRFFLQALKVSVMSAAEYKTSFIIQTVFMFINNGFFLVFWNVVFRINKGNMNGVSFNNILYLYSIPVISYGVAYFFFGGCTNINQFIITGQMDSFMLQPKCPLLNVLTSKCNFSAFGDLLYGIVIGLFATKGNMLSFSLLVILGIFGSIFHISTDIIFRSISVWLKDTEEIARVYTHSLLTTFSSYPEQIFGKCTKVLLYTVIPAAYISYIPIKIIDSFNLFYIGLIFIVGILYMLVAILIFNKAMKSYESGNLVSMKM